MNTIFEIDEDVIEAEIETSLAKDEMTAAEEIEAKLKETILGGNLYMNVDTIGYPAFRVYFPKKAIILFIWLSNRESFNDACFQQLLAADFYLRFQPLTIRVKESQVKVTMRLDLSSYPSVDLHAVAEEACFFQQCLFTIDDYRTQAMEKPQGGAFNGS